MPKAQLITAMLGNKARFAFKKRAAYLSLSLNKMHIAVSLEYVKAEVILMSCDRRNGSKGTRSADKRSWECWLKWEE